MWRPSTATWYVLGSSAGVMAPIPSGSDDFDDLPPKFPLFTIGARGGD